MLTASKAEIARQKVIAELERRGVDWRAVLAQREERPPLPSLQEWCEATLPHPLHEWQKQLCWELEPLKEGGRHRLLIHGPPRYGKSIIVGQRLIPWLIMHNPSWRCPLMTYNIDHSVEFGEVVRDLMRSDVYKQWAPRGAWLEREDCSAQAFKTVARSRTMDGDYSFRALGFQTGFTGKGADCLVGETKIQTPKGEARIDELRTGDAVIGYDFIRNDYRVSRIRGTRKRQSSNIVRVEFESGASVTCTADHRFYSVERGYIGAALLSEREAVCSLAQDWSLLPLRRPGGRVGLGVPFLPECSDSGPAKAEMHLVRQGVRTACLRSAQSAKERAKSGLLQCGLPERSLRGKERAQVQEVCQADAGGKASLVLLRRVPQEACALGEMPAVRLPVGQARYAADVLLSRLRGQRPFAKDARGREFEVQDRHELRQVVSNDEAADYRARQVRLRSLRAGDGFDGYGASSEQDSFNAPRSPYRQQPGEQRAGEPCTALQELPSGAPFSVRSFDRVKAVRQVCGPSVPVYDIEVEGTNNFFASGVLVHNCLVGDDPYANPEDAGSEAVNGRTIRTYKNQVRLRVGADSPLIFMYHRYHENDLGGELLAEGDWRNIRFPCIADSSDNEDGSDITGRSDGELLSDLWPEDHIQHIREDDPYTFASMYQGRPKPPGGGFFKSDWFVTGEMPPVSLKVRYWDLATSVKKTGDWTASALAGVDAIQRFCLEDVMRMKGEWPDVCQKIVEITEREAYEFGMRGIRYAVGVDARMSQQGFFQQLMRQRIFDMKTGDGLRVPLWPDKAPIDKKESASGLAADMRYGRFVMKADPVWNQVFKNECLAFTGQDTDTDDQVDAASGCHRLLWALRGATNVEKPKAEVGSPAWFDKLGKKQAGVGLFRA